MARLASDWDWGCGDAERLGVMLGYGAGNAANFARHGGNWSGGGTRYAEEQLSEVEQDMEDPDDVTPDTCRMWDGPETARRTVSNLLATIVINEEINAIHRRASVEDPGARKQDTLVGLALDELYGA